MRRTVSTWTEFATAWDGLHNFLLAGECTPFIDFPIPPLDQLVDTIRRDDEARINPGTRGDRIDATDDSARFRALPLERALEAPFALTHFNLPKFAHPGGLLDGFREKVMQPWQDALTAAGFTWNRIGFYIFAGGPGCGTNYHHDRSFVLAWQIHGRKRFCGLKDPLHWCPPEEQLRPGFEISRPANLTDDDAFCYDMNPGDVLWNMLLTPHWVEAGDTAAASFNISHGGLAYRGTPCGRESALMTHLEKIGKRPPPSKTY